MAWRHAGGGCMVNTPGLACDDEYQEDETEKEICFFSTPAAHFRDFPKVIEDMDQFLRSIAGREDIKVHTKLTS